MICIGFKKKKLNKLIFFFHFSERSWIKKGRGRDKE